MSLMLYLNYKPKPNHTEAINELKVKYCEERAKQKLLIRKKN